jgi:hypothetical protein
MPGFSLSFNTRSHFVALAGLEFIILLLCLLLGLQACTTTLHFHDNFLNDFKYFTNTVLWLMIDLLLA